MAVRDKADEVITKAKRRVGLENPSAADDDGNVGIVRGSLRAFGEGDFDAFLDALKEDVAWEAPRGNFPGGSETDGRQGVKDRFIADIGRTYTQFGFVPDSFLDAEDENAVVVMGRFVGEGTAGATVDAPAVQVWQLSGSEAELIRIYTDSAMFAKVVTEEDLREEEKKEEKEEKAESEDDTEGESDDDTERKSEDDSEGKSEEKSESKSDSDSSAKSDDQAESSSDEDAEAKADDEADSESKSGSEAEAKSDA